MYVLGVAMVMVMTAGGGGGRTACRGGPKNTGSMFSNWGTPAPRGVGAQSG